MSTTSSRTRLGALALAVAGVLFLLYPALRPWNDETTAAGALASMGSGAWVAAHLFAMIGFILVPLGLLALVPLVRGTRGESLALPAVLVTWIGAGLTLPYYGAEDFALHAIAGQAAGGGFDLPAMADAVRFGPVAATTFALGLLSLGGGAVLAAIAVTRSGVLARGSAVLFAVGFALFIPQFFGPPALRVVHGVILAAGLIQLAVAMSRVQKRNRTPEPVPAP
ncbi:hypothetical protein [Pseudonocardia sp. GCM10023141]|uniref:hypothetical protein n=1 Tax=Pseudonocardia sp. GCM10023141 TaxID=3252653 RepID=UPI0036188C33